MVQSLEELALLVDMDIEMVKEAWEKSFGGEEGSLPPEVMAAKIRAVDNMSTEILKHWLKKEIRPNDLEKKGGK